MGTENPERRTFDPRLGGELAANEDDNAPDVEAHRRHFGTSEEPNASDDDAPDVEAHRRHFGTSEEPNASDDDEPDVEGHMRHKQG